MKWQRLTLANLSIARLWVFVGALSLFISGCTSLLLQTSPPVTVNLLTESHKVPVPVNQEMVITSISRSNAGIKRVEFWVDGDLKESLSDQPDFPDVEYIVDHKWTPSGEKEYEIEIVAEDMNGQRDSFPFIVKASEHPIIAVATVFKADETQATPTPIPTGVAVSCGNKGLLVEHVTIPIGSEIDPGQTFEKTWNIRNIGTCPWTTDYYLENVSGPTLGGTRVNLPNVPIGGEIEITIQMSAPVVGGTYRSVWKLFDGANKSFEPEFPVEIIVPNTCEFPKINQFSAVPAAITLGQNSTISWEVTGADTISLNPGPQLNSAQGSVTVSPNNTTTYILDAVAGPCSDQRQLTVSIIQPSNSLPVAPSNLQVSTVAQTNMTLTWNDNSNNETEFRLYNVDTNQHIFTYPANDSQGLVTGLTCGTQYRWQLYAYNSQGLSTASNMAVISTNACN